MKDCLVYSIYLVVGYHLFQFRLARYDLHDRRRFVMNEDFDHRRCRDIQVRCDGDYHRRRFRMNEDFDLSR